MDDLAELNVASRALLEARARFWELRKHLDILDGQGHRDSEEWHVVKAQADEARAAGEAAQDKVLRLLHHNADFLESAEPTP